MSPAAPPPLQASLQLAQGSFQLDVDLAEPGSWLAVLGPSGCGKTTLLGCLAGLRQPDAGSIVLQGRVVLDTSRRINLPPRLRGIGAVSQRGDLFPHLSVLDNLRFGMSRARQEQAHGAGPSSLDEVVELLQLAHLADRAPSMLSGGERQRVALGRALLSGPRLLLLDEPLSALDGGLRDRLLTYLLSIKERYRIPCVYVTHSEHEALSLADRLVLMDQGRVVERGAPHELLGSPTRVHPLRSLGAHVQNLLEARVVDHQREAGVTMLALEDGALLSIPHEPELALQAPVQLSVRADSLLLARGEPEVSARNQLRGQVVEMVEVEGAVFVRIACKPGPLLWARITMAALHSLHLTLADEVLVLIKSPSIAVSHRA